MKRVYLFTFLWMAFFLLFRNDYNKIYASEGLIEELAGSSEYEELERTVKKLLKEEDFSFTGYIKRVLSGDEPLSVGNFLKRAGEALFGGLSGLKREFVKLVGIVLFTAVFTSFARAFHSTQVSESGFYVSYLLLFSVLAAGYLSVSSLVTETLERLFHFMEVLVPVFCATLAFAAGSITSQAAVATLLMILALADYVLITVLLPVIHIYMMAVLANHLTEEEPLGKLTELLARGVKLALKALMGFVGGIGMLQAMITPAVDQVRRKSVLRVSELVPGLGGLFSGVSETLLGAGNIIKNAVGTGGMLVILFLCLLPMGKVLLSMLCYRAGAAVVEPVADKRILNCLSDTAEGIAMLFQSLAAGAALFLLILAILIRATS